MMYNKRNPDLKQRLRGAGITYKDLADYMGVNESTISRWANDKGIWKEKIEAALKELAPAQD